MYYNLQIGKMNMLFTYFTDKKIDLGTYCIVDYNNKKVEAVVVQKSSKSKFDFEIKEIEEILDKKLDDKLFSLISWIHRYYLEPFSSLIPIIEEPEKTKINDKNIKKIKSQDYTLNDEQKKVYEDIKNSNKLVHLIDGITGSGKTQVYISLIKDALSKNCGSIILVPEITLTSQLKNSLEKTFGDRIALWHSKLTKKAKYEYYKLLEQGKIKVVLGARSAIFTNVKNLKYIIIDEEHETTYKQEESPRYHVKNVAIKRALLENAKVVLGSATPSFDTMYQVKSGDIVYHRLTKRYMGAKLPTYIVKDISNEKDFLTQELIENINEKIEKEEQVILLFNRKAYSVLVKCKDCKREMECDKCSCKLTYYKSGILKCNECGTTYNMVKSCKYCSSIKLDKIGVGTEKLEEKLKELFDENKILRMDADSMTSKTKMDKAYQDFLSKKYDILIGTQILAKGFHFPDVTLVGILNADQMLSFPDYRAFEKSFQLITQASGRAGRSKKSGEVFIQTFNPDSILIKSVVNNDYNLIYENQMEMREKLFYPPYSKHIKILFTDTNEKRCFDIANKTYELLLNKFSMYAKIYPVSKCSMYKASKRYRLNINLIYDRKNDSIVKKLLRGLLNLRSKIITRILIDVDPTNMS